MPNPYIIFEFVGGPNDGRIVEGPLGEGGDVDRYYAFSNRGTVGQVFKVASDYAVETLAKEELKIETRHHFQPHYYRVTDRLEEGDQLWIRAEYVRQ